MSNNLQNLDIIDLISERHIQLRNITENLWNNQSEINISNSEWSILSRIYQCKETTISYVTRNVNISRQATHKFIKNLKEKGLVDVYDAEHNKKEKCVKLTELGILCFEKNTALKADLEREISETIGMEQLEKLKELLVLEWGTSAVTRE